MKKLRYILTLLALAFTALVASAQNRTVKGNVTFAADGFSVYGIVYTVDFGYEVDGVQVLPYEKKALFGRGKTP